MNFDFINSYKILYASDDFIDYYILILGLMMCARVITVFILISISLFGNIIGVLRGISVSPRIF